jgi:SP family sugar:H+ symporter-like MFS transporter
VLTLRRRKEEAIKATRKLFATPTNQFDAVDYCDKLEVAYQEEKSSAESTGWLDLIRQPDLRRLLIAVGVQSLQHAQGSSYMTSYIVSFLIGTGVTNYYPIVMALNCVYLVACGTGYLLPDVLGRRQLLITPSAICGACLITVAALVTAYPTPPPAVQKASIGLIFIWYFFFGVQGPAVWMVTAESAPARNREKVLGMATFFGFGVSLIINFVAPYIQNKGYGNLGSKIGFIWGTFSLLMVFYPYFWVPEYKGHSLEQIDYLFGQGIPARKFGAYRFTDNVLATAVDVEDAKGAEAAVQVDEVEESK